MVNNINLNKATKNKYDEFYTQYKDIENEIVFYKTKLSNKIIYCNCDDVENSNFVKYFVENFAEYKLKGLICSSYNESGNGKKGVYDKKTKKMKIYKLEENGDFNSKECVKLLRESDICITNPPFSKFRELLTLLEKEKKSFILLGNQNAITYKETIALFKNKKMWLGNNHGSMEFVVPNNWNYGNTYIKNEKKYAKFGNICWFTNIKSTKFNSLIKLTKKYSDNAYSKYVNYDAIEVGKLSDIPYDYFGEMGVPITFMNVYNPKQFVLVGFSSELAIPMKKIATNNNYSKGGPRFYIKEKKGKYTYRRLYDRVVIKHLQS